MKTIRKKRFWASCFCFMAAFFLLITFQVIVELGKSEQLTTKNSVSQNDASKEDEFQKYPSLFFKKPKPDHNTEKKFNEDRYPILLWWSPLTGESGRRAQCGLDACFFTINRTYQHNPMTKAFLFYGTDFSIDNLPLPRADYHDWALFHEESPKNNYKLFQAPAITLFNHTATFSRHSHLPLTTQYLESIEALKSLKYTVSLPKKNSLRKRLAPLAYIQSDCDPPSDRDSYVKELMAHIEIDSYGACLHNRDLPEHLQNPASMDSDSFHKILAQYKFVLAFENAVCEDYITEKLWRPLKLGVVPIYYGSPTIQDWLPSNKSAILITEFSHPKDLAQYIKALDADDKEYVAYLEWKLKGDISNKQLLAVIKERTWGVQDIMKDNYIDAFECMVCTRVWENIRRQAKGMLPRRWKAEANHLSCPRPQAFAFSPLSVQRTVLQEVWRSSFDQSKREAHALQQLVERNRNFTALEFWTLVFRE
ncbi:alpha-(1,3)-fucosyltransferase 10 [Python bivittatus]|uniref:GDP-fucose protein O-fucosyltransferase n=1 Tax=Python bivittatus TaxID=176946 RepID=A0A9F5IUY2_PYTBI|nr:alpha-(1,3)-fucosyltransferase 10 [Python bivittatus]XP_015744572.1 alpha-(1,3)-fucosyltransferase 10 [Python bivittatus]XP_025026277.1 alpha-(1,3)-fucosyltransferase 10 [Python bivittatus]